MHHVRRRLPHGRPVLGWIPRALPRCRLRAVNQSWLCDRGRFGFEAVQAPGRLAQPLVRTEDDLVPTTWHEALSRVADALGRAVEGPGAASVGVIGGARLANEDAYAWVRLTKGVIGTDNFDAQLGDGLPAGLVACLPRATIERPSPRARS